MAWWRRSTTPRDSSSPPSGGSARPSSVDSPTTPEPSASRPIWWPRSRSWDGPDAISSSGSAAPANGSAGGKGGAGGTAPPGTPATAPRLGRLITFWLGRPGGCRPSRWSPRAPARSWTSGPGCPASGPRRTAAASTPRRPHRTRCADRLTGTPRRPRVRRATPPRYTDHREHLAEHGQRTVIRGKTSRARVVARIRGDARGLSRYGSRRRE